MEGYVKQQQYKANMAINLNSCIVNMHLTSGIFERVANNRDNAIHVQSVQIIKQ